MARKLEETLQALYNSEINVTITTLWDGGFDLALCSYMDAQYDDMTEPGWHNVRTAAELGDAMHAAALREYPTSEYARSHGVVAGLHLVKEED
jgi:hypothetical protein